MGQVQTLERVVEAVPQPIPTFMTPERIALLSRIEQGVTTTRDRTTVYELIRDLWECTTGSRARGKRIVAALNAGKIADAVKEAKLAMRLDGAD